MFSVRRVVLTLALGLAVGAGPALADPALAAPRFTDLAALMSGRQEVPGPGDADAWGGVTVRVYPRAGRICYSMYVQGIDGQINAAHVHAGRSGVAGPHVVDLDPPTPGWARGCEDVDPMLAKAIAKWPNRYYVNVHSTAFPNGAIRGQLRSQGHH